MSRTLIAHLTDSHFEPDGKLAHGKYATGACLERAVAAIAALDPRPDLVLHTGDACHHGDLAAYRELRRILERTGCPVFVIPGNHDETEAMREAFADTAWMPRDGRFLHFTVEDWPVRLICLDSKIPGVPDGALCDERLDWLAARLAEAPGRPTLIALHHPPIRTGRTCTDVRPLGNVDALRRLVAQHPNVELLVAGHVHCVLQARFGGAVALTGPSTAYQFAVDRRPGAPLSLIDEPPGFYVHDHEPEAGFTSHLVPVGDYPGPFPFVQDGKLLPLPWLPR